MCVLLIVYSTGTLHIIGGNTTCRATSVSDSIVKVHKQSHFTCANYICSDTVFSEATVMELIDRVWLARTTTTRDERRKLQESMATENMLPHPHIHTW